MNNFFIHDVLTFSFFYSGIVAITLFNLVIIFDKQNKISKWLLIPGIVAVASFASFLIIPYIASSAHGYTLHPHRLVRSHIRLKPVLEWSVFFTLIAWIVLMSIYLMTKRRTMVAKIAVVRSSKARKYDSEKIEKMEG